MPEGVCNPDPRMCHGPNTVRKDNNKTFIEKKPAREGGGVTTTRGCHGLSSERKEK